MYLWISDAYPWQISLTYSGGSHICGGSIINEKQVICAAHCVEGMENLAVSYGIMAIPVVEFSRDG